MEAVEKARITVVVDNHVDALLTERPDIERFTMLKHFVPPHGSRSARRTGSPTGSSCTATGAGTTSCSTRA